MDPATIIGTTSAILSFVQFSGNVISTAMQIHDSASGASEDNQKFADVIANFKDRSERLRKLADTFQSKASNTGGDRALNDAERQLLTTINKCDELAGKIDDVLKKTIAADNRDEKLALKSSRGRALFRELFHSTKVEKTSSITSPKTGPMLSDAIKAALQTVWQKEAVEELRKDWESCSIQLDQAVFRFETSNQLGLFHGVLQNHTAELVDIRDLVGTLVKTSHKVAHLQSFLYDMQKADSVSSREKRNHEKILDALKFPGMQARRDRVSQAAGNTFSWLIEDEAIPENLSLSLRISLRQWLRTGTGVFHVTGKPGSGKSTFMKLIDESKEAALQLQRWAAGNRKGLIRASCYLWKAAEANSLQNELEGLARTLLLQILQQAPSLTSALFQAHPSWDPQNFTLINYITNSHSTAVTLEPQEILAALESVLAMSDYHYFLLIDGLDEMKNTREDGHKEIAERILHWSTHNSGNVKICVSSREDRAFIETFHGKQRLPLHTVTSEDIKTLVDLKLKSYKYLTSEEREVLAATISKQARGVFLWVVLAIGNLMPLFNDKQSFWRLKQQLKTLPEEMNDFLVETLTRIPECYRKEAWAVFTIRASLNPGHNPDTYSLIHYSMLEKCLDSSGGRLREHEELMGAEHAAHQGQEFVSRFSRFSSGLLGIPGSSFNQPVSLSRAWEIRPLFTHRSVYDFLQDHPDKLSKALAIPGELDRLSGPELVMRSTIQLVNHLSLEELSMDPWGIFGTSPIWFYMDSKPMFPLAKILEEAILRKQKVILDHQPFNETRWTDLRIGPHTSSLFQKALTSDSRAFVDWAQKGHYPSWLRSKEFKAWTVERVFHSRCVSGTKDCHFKRKGGFSFTHVDIVVLHEQGWLSYNDLMKTDHSLIPGFSPVLRGPLWLHLLIAVLLSDTGVICDDLAKHYIEISKDVVNLDVQFEWWSDCYSTGQSGSASGISAEDGDVLAETRRPPWLGLAHGHEDLPEDKPGAEIKEQPWDESENKLRLPKSDFANDESERSKNYAESGSDALREWIRKCKSKGVFPRDSRFGMTVKMGGDEEPQMIQGPQWTDIQDNELLPKFVAIFKKAAGITTFKDLLRIWVFRVLEEHHSIHLFEKWASDVREGREDLEVARKELDDDIKRREITLQKRSMGVLGTWYWFPLVYDIISMVEAPPSPVLPKELSDDTRHNGGEDIKKPDDHERRQVFNDSAVDMLTDKAPRLRKTCQDWSRITILCLGLLLAICIGRIFHQ